MNTIQQRKTIEKKPGKAYAWSNKTLKPQTYTPAHVRLHLKFQSPIKTPVFVTRKVHGKIFWSAFIPTNIATDTSVYERLHSLKFAYSHIVITWARIFTVRHSEQVRNSLPYQLAWQLVEYYRVYVHFVLHLFSIMGFNTKSATLLTHPHTHKHTKQFNVREWSDVEIYFLIGW